MFGIHDLPLFILAGLLLNITPGPDMLYIAGRTASQGFRSGLAAVMGINAGCLVHTLAGAIGFSALLMASAQAFLVVKLVGAAYLVYVGISLLLEKQKGVAEISNTLPSKTTRQAFWQGFLTNVLNPKVALFFLAFLPQFISSDSNAKPAAFVVLGIIFIFNSLFITIGLVTIVARARTRFKGASRIALWLNRSCGALFIAIGVKLALTDSVSRRVAD
jgi:threonine/homoserine/homoserine lactone efflux protein